MTVGSEMATTNQDEANKVTHLFMNTVKKKNLKATYQGGSGRCWMFAGLNTMRHMLIRAMDLDKFAFSQTYLFFWDKFECANTFLQWFLDHPDANPGDRAFDYMVAQGLGDGGWWNTFTNLVEKYGLVPKTAMEETFQSDDSDSMNRTLMLYLNSAVCQLRRGDVSDPPKFKRQIMSQVFSILVKFLGTPPSTFDWTFHQGEQVETMVDLNPTLFRNMLTDRIPVGDFVVLVDLPYLQRNKRYTLLESSNVVEGRNLTFLNIGAKKMATYTQRSVLSGLSVWFAADVCKCFNMFHSTLNDRINDEVAAFGPLEDMTKEEAMRMRDVEANHAMAFTGFNMDESGKEIRSWQVENSWGYLDNETEGLDGFLCMSHSWFLKYVIQVSVNCNLLTSSDRKLLQQEPVELLPWEFDGAAHLKISGKGAPRGYLPLLQQKAGSSQVRSTNMRK
jgi:bleomycin hydrolase